MQHGLESICIVTKQGLSTARDIAEQLSTWLAVRGIHAVVVESENLGFMEQTVRQADCIVVLGGDGSMLSVARKSMALEKPLLGINLGKVGFLAEIAPDNWQEPMQRLLEDGIRVRQRLALYCRVMRGENCVFEGTAVNDVVLHRGVLARVINLGMEVDGESLGGLRADGLIVSTPTGSTGYAVSAGGPLVHPEMQVYTITPICPFLHTFHPMVLQGSMHFSVHIVQEAQEVYVTLDGQECFALEPGDILTTTKARQPVLFVAIEGVTYAARLRAKGFIQGSGSAMSFTEGV